MHLDVFGQDESSGGWLPTACTQLPAGAAKAHLDDVRCAFKISGSVLDRFAWQSLW